MRQRLDDAQAYGLEVFSKLAKVSAKPAAATGTYTMVDDHPPVLILTPTATMVVLLPPEKPHRMYYVWNKSAGAFDLTVKEDSGVTTVLTVSQNEAAILYCDGAGVWHRALLNAAAT